MFSPLINWALGHITGGSLPSWKYMYLFAGCLTILWSFVVLFFLPGDPIRARGFTDRERYIIISRMRTNNTGVRNTHFKWGQALELVLDIKFWILFVISVLVNNTNGLISTYSPILIAGMGFSVFDSLLLLIPIGFITGLGLLIATYLAYKFTNRRTLLMAGFQILVIIGSLLLWQLPQTSRAGGLTALHILWGFPATYALLMGLQVANTAGYTKRSLSSAGIFFGYCIGKDDRPKNILGTLNDNFLI